MGDTQKSSEFEATLVYIVRLCLKKSLYYIEMWNTCLLTMKVKRTFKSIHWKTL